MELSKYLEQEIQEPRRSFFSICKQSLYRGLLIPVLFFTFPIWLVGIMIYYLIVAIQKKDTSSFLIGGVIALVCIPLLGIVIFEVWSEITSQETEIWYITSFTILFIVVSTLSIAREFRQLLHSEQRRIARRIRKHTPEAIPMNTLFSEKEYATAATMLKTWKKITPEQARKKYPQNELDILYLSHSIATDDSGKLIRMHCLKCTENDEIECLCTA